MANVSGKSGGAYATVNRSANYFGGAMQNAQDNAFRFRQERKVKEDEAKAQKEAELEKVKIPDLKNIATLNSNLEKAKAKVALETRQSFLDAQNAINNAKTTEEKQLAYAKANNLKNNFDLLNSFSTPINDKIKYLTDNFDKLDEQSSSQAMQKLLMAGKGYGDIEIQPDGQIMFSVNDEKGNPLSEKNTLAGFLGSIEDEVLKKSTFEDELVKSVNSVGKLTKVDDLGNQTIEDTGVTPENKEISKNAFIKSILGDDSNRRIYARNNNIKQDDNEAIVKSISDLYDSKFDETHKKTYNTAIMNYNAGRDDEAYQRRKDAQEKSKKDAEENEKKTRIEQYSVVTEDGNYEGKKVYKDARIFPVTNGTITYAGGKSATPTNIVVNKQGKIYLRVEKHGGASTTTTTKTDEGNKSLTEKQVEVKMLDFGKDAKEIGVYAKKMGFAGAGELQAHVIKLSGGDKFITTPKAKPKAKPKTYAGIDPKTGKAIYK